MRQADHLLIFGASVRAAAFSALRAGLRPWCADLFADADLRGRCSAMQLPGRYPDRFLDLVQMEVPGPWMYTGGLENHPRLIRQMESCRPLWGNGPGVLSRSRDPELLAWSARAAGLPAPVVSWRRRQPPGPGRWLIKPVAGSGGAGIRFWSEERARTARKVYLQQYVEGTSAAVLYVAAGGSVRLIGLSQQLVGEDFLRAPDFRYCGSIGPLACADGLRQKLVRLGDELVRRTDVRGLFGVDGILREGEFWPVEVNPRYTASVEVYEYATGLRSLQLHRAAFENTQDVKEWSREGEAPAEPRGNGSAGASPSPFFLALTLATSSIAQEQDVVGKAILYARIGGVFPEDGPWRETLDRPQAIDAMPTFADLPNPGSRLESGRPVLTLLARAARTHECLALLRERAAEVERWLYR